MIFISENFLIKKVAVPVNEEPIRGVSLIKVFPPIEIASIFKTSSPPF